MRRKAFLSLISIVAAVPLVLGSAVVAQALPVSYADNPASREAMGFSTSFTSIAQSFTAKATGQLRSVTFTHVTFQAATASVSLWSFVGGVPSANLSTSNAVSTNAYGAKQYSFTTASVTAGTQYAFVFNGAPADYALLTSAGNAYTQGDLLLQANGAWTTSTAFDATFSTVINDSTTAPTLSGTPPTSLVQGSNVNFQFTVAGNPTPSVSLSSGQLPTGLTLSYRTALRHSHCRRQLLLHRGSGQRHIRRWRLDNSPPYARHDGDDPAAGCPDDQLGDSGSPSGDRRLLRTRAHGQLTHLELPGHGEQRHHVCRRERIVRHHGPRQWRGLLVHRRGTERFWLEPRVRAGERHHLAAARRVSGHRDRG